MTKKNVTIISLSALLIFALAATSMAGPGFKRANWDGCNGPACASGPFERLTPEKRAEVDKVFEKYEAKFDELRTQMQTKHSVLQAMINGGQADEKKIGQLVGDMSKLRKDMRDTREAMTDELEKVTGLVLNGPGNCPGFGPGFGGPDGQGKGRGGQRGMGPGQGQGNGPGMY